MLDENNSVQHVAHPLQNPGMFVVVHDYCNAGAKSQLCAVITFNITN